MKIILIKIEMTTIKIENIYKLNFIKIKREK